MGEVDPERGPRPRWCIRSPDPFDERSDRYRPTHVNRQGGQDVTFARWSEINLVAAGVQLDRPQQVELHAPSVLASVLTDFPRISHTVHRTMHHAQNSPCADSSRAVP